MSMSNVSANRPGQFNFGLSTVQEARAAKLHHESIVIDLLSQHAGGSNIFAQYPPYLQRDFRARIRAAGSGLGALAEAEYWPYEMSRLGKSDLIHEWYALSGLTCGTFGIDELGSRTHERGWEFSQRYADLPWIRYVTAAAEIRESKREGAVAFYVHCQPVMPIPRDLKAIDGAYVKGLRSMMLTYNRMDNVGTGCTERVDAGLSMFGIEVVKHCNDIGMVVDVSHCGHLTTMDACRISKQPVNANHTAAKGVYVHARGKSDDALRAIAETGGVIGVVVVPAFVTNDEHPTIEHTLDHMDYIANLVGWQHVAIGTDWPLQAPQDVLEDTFGKLKESVGFRPQDRLDLTQRMEGFEDCRDLPNFTRGLVKRGYSDEQIRGILGENALRVFSEVWGS